MFQRKRIWRWLIPVVGIMALASAPTASAGSSVPDWIRHNAAPLEDIRRAVGGAQIVGLGESTHGVAEQLTLKHQTLRVLVEQLGFRSVAWEEQWTTGLQVNEYIRTGAGDLNTLMSQLGGQWQSREVADVLRWLRDFNAGRADKVQFVGVEYYLTGLPAYDTIKTYVDSAAPEHSAELRRDLRPIRPMTSDIFEHIAKYQKAPDKQTFIDHAHNVRDLVAGIRHQPGDPEHFQALNSAQQIVSFYEHYRMSFADSLVYRDAQAAQNVERWREFSGDKIAYWAASPHVANAPQLRIVVPDMSFASAGSYLRHWYGHRYLAIGFTYDHGTVRVEPTRTEFMPPPAPDWFEHPLGKVHIDQFMLDLRRPAPASVRQWLTAPIKTRGLPGHGPDSVMVGGTLAQWFDVLVHRQAVTPMRPI